MMNSENPHRCNVSFFSRTSLLISVMSFSAFFVGTINSLAGAKYGKNAVPLSDDASYFRAATKTDFWQIIPYYVSQHNEKACGVASSIMGLNALLNPTRTTADTRNIDVEALFKLGPKFKKNVGTTGKGFTLDDLGESLKSVLETMNSARYTVTVDRFDGKDSKAELKRLEKLFAANEKNPNDFIIINFLQGVLTGDKEGMIGHISPVAAYDAKKKRVLILDTDRKYYQPYWSPVDKVFDAMNTTDPSTSKKRGLIILNRETGAQ